MRFDIVTIFPECFESFFNASLLGKARAAGLVEVGFVDPRDFTRDKHRSVDDTPYGGGEGMVIKPEPMVAALASIASQAGQAAPHRVLLTPQGRAVGQADFQRLLGHEHVVLVCGRYEGFDERIRTFVDEELSLGDFVLNGGEVAAMAVVDGVARLVPGVLGNERSLQTESHESGLLEHPQYTRPRVFRDLGVPEVLLQGDHERIRRWRRREMLERTRSRRPDMWARFRPNDEDLELLGADHHAHRMTAARTYIALIHHPVYDRTGRVITTAITNLDLHDIARSSRTFGLGGYFVVTPLSSQRELAIRILSHWKDGYGAVYNPKRKEALSLVEVASSLEEVIERIEQREGARPVTVGTTAARREGQLDHGSLAAAVGGGQPVLLLVGTGWGLVQEVLDSADFSLAPLEGGTSYNHLSVRSAVAIVLDRFFGMRLET